MIARFSAAGNTNKLKLNIKEILLSDWGHAELKGKNPKGVNISAVHRINMQREAARGDSCRALR